MRTPRTMLGAAFAAALTIAALSGCTAGTTDTADAASTSPQTTGTPQAPATEAPAPVVTPTLGATITSDDEAAAAQAAGLGVYDTFDADGNYVNSIVFDKAAPLPEPVKSAIAAPVIAAFAEAMATGVSGETATAAQVAAVSASEQKATSAASSASRETGKNIVIVLSSYGALDGVHYGVYWGATSAESQIRNSAAATAEGAVAKAQAWIATQPNPETYEIVIAG